MHRATIASSQSGTVPWPDEVVARYVARGYWDGRSLGESLYAAADARPDAVCLVDGDRRLTFRDLMARADGAALRLRDLGLRPDDRVVVQLPNCWEFVVVTIACLRLGVIPALALPTHRRHEITPIVAHSEARALFVSATAGDFDLQAMARSIADESATAEHVLVTGAQVGRGNVDLRALCRPAGNPALARKELDTLAPPGTALALFFLSGGTTGTPKLIGRTHNDFAFMSRRAAQICGVGPESVYLAALPMGHGFPISGPGVFGTLMAGGRAVIIPSPAPERAFPAIERDRVTITSLVPAAIQRWLEHRQAHPGHDLGSLRLIQSGAARLPPTLARQVRPVLGATLQQVYGMSEGLLCLTRPDDPDEVIWHTQGRPICSDDELRFVDEDGRPVPPGEPGVLLTRGPYTPRGYYRAPDLDAAAFVGDGWYRTGDIVRQRPDGNLVVEGRDKDVINRGGEKIAANEVETAAHRLAGIRTAVAVPMPDRELGERICLYVVPQPDAATVTLGEVRAALHRAGLAHFKLPERLVIVTDLPRTSVGKTDRKALRADITARLAAQPSPAPPDGDPGPGRGDPATAGHPPKRTAARPPDCDGA